VIALLSSILSLIIIFLLFENWRKSNKNLKAQEILNDKIAEQNKKQEKLLQDLEHSNKEKDRILRAVAHDIRNPLGAIAALNHMLSENLKDTSDENKELMSLINNATSDTLALSQDILQASHNLKNLPLELEDVLVQKLVNNIVHLLQFKAKEKKHKIEVKLPEQPVYVHVNREKISRVLDNLISNAIKFSYEGATIIVSAGVKGSKVVIQVADSGVGIPNHFKHKVFDIFTEAKRLGTSGEKPFGLGLSISRQIVEAHGGEIWFESSEGKGSVFSFSLPG
jgi:signal transduction histidine kinase